MLPTTAPIKGNQKQPLKSTSDTFNQKGLPNGPNGSSHVLRNLRSAWEDHVGNSQWIPNGGFHGLEGLGEVVVGGVSAKMVSWCGEKTS